MDAVQAMTGQGGWPMTVFLTPAGQPFYGGTYFPPEPRYGMPAFQQVLRPLADAYRTRREQVASQAAAADRRAAAHAQPLAADGGDLSTAARWTRRSSDCASTSTTRTAASATRPSSPSP